jgi:hypothetical protein
MFDCLLYFFNSHLLNIFSRADYADDEYIQELIIWENPRLFDSSPFQFTDAENLALLNLPRKECMSSGTSRNSGLGSNPTSLT